MAAISTHFTSSWSDRTLQLCARFSIIIGSSRDVYLHVFLVQLGPWGVPLSRMFTFIRGLLPRHDFLGWLREESELDSTLNGATLIFAVLTGYRMPLLPPG